MSLVCPYKARWFPQIPQIEFDRIHSTVPELFWGEKYNIKAFW